MEVSSIFNLTTSTLVIPDQGSVLRPSPLISDEISHPFERFTFMVTLAMSLIGIVTNAINIRVFVEQGLSDSTTIGFFALSIFDLLGCITLIPVSLCYLIWQVKGYALHLTCMAFTNMPSSYPHVVLSKISNWITVYMSVERSLCVVLPMKIKQFFTPRVTTAAIFLITIFFIAFHIPYPIFTRILWMHHPILNITFAYAHDTPTAKTILRTTSSIISILTSVAMAIVFTTTSLMIFKMLQYKRWRQRNMAAKTTQVKNEQSNDPDQPTNKTYTPEQTSKPQSSKDVEIIKSVLVVTSIFLVCLAISHVPGITLSTIPGTTMSGYNKNLFRIAFTVRFLFDAINAAVNFFFYVRISSRYKSAFRAVFSKKSQSDNMNSKK